MVARDLRAMMAPDEAHALATPRFSAGYGISELSDHAGG
jgi:hypothetical protein